MRHKWIALAVAVALTLPLAGTQASEKKEIRVGFTLDALTLDPANHRNRETQTILRNMYDGLMTRNAWMDVVPELVESWTQPDDLTYELKLRQGVKFHSGDEMTADDVKFTFERLTVEGAMDGQTSPRKSLLGPLERIEVLDRYSVRFVLSDPWPMLPAMLPFQEVVSKSFVEKVGTDGMATQVNGTGPFKLVEWRKGDSIIMERFDDYYGGAAEIPPEGKACVDRVIFKVIPENASRVAALLAGDVDIINELPVHNIKQVDENHDTEMWKINGTRTFFVALNTHRPPFDDLRVRQAANHALDKDLIIEKVLLDNAVPLNGVLSPDAFGFNPDLPAYEYDPEKARRLLAEAGHPDGIDVTLDVEGAFKEIAEAVGSLLTKSGIRTKVVVGESSQLRSKWRTSEDKEGDMWFTSWGNGSLDPVGIFVPTLRSEGRGNSAGYTNPEVDRLLDAASSETDDDERAGLYREAQVIVSREAPWVFLWLPQDIYGVSTRVTQWHPSSDSRINLHDACVE